MLADYALDWVVETEVKAIALWLEMLAFQRCSLLRGVFHARALS
jgi:hypothetical protein